ncbi:MAG: hypothetical protein ACRD18_02590 [Terriglobia bacterium]
MQAQEVGAIGAFYQRKDGAWVWFMPTLGIYAISDNQADCEAQFRAMYLDVIQKWDIFGKHLKN